MIKKITLLTITLISVMLLLDFNTRDVHSNSSGAPAGKTGSPGDGSNCSSCHSTNGTPTLGTLLITSNVPSGGYISGNTYLITVRSAHATFNKFGFQVSPQSNSGTLLGTLSINNTTETQLVGSNKYVTHKAAGTAGTNIPSVGNYKEWTFNWTAPAPGTGAVTFYGASILANSNNQNNGDSLALATLVIPESATNGINTVSNSKEIKLFPNPANNFVNISLPKNAEIFIMNMSGKTIIQQNLNTGINNIDISRIPSGIYFAKIEGKEFKDILKFLKK